MLNWHAVQISNVWHVVNILTDEQIRIVWEHQATDLAMRLNIRDCADYASVGEFDWRLTVKGSNFRHAAMPQIGDYFANSLTLCDRQKEGVVWVGSSLKYCPDCLAEIQSLNNGFIPAYDFRCDFWQANNWVLGKATIQANNQAYTKHLKMEVL